MLFTLTYINFLKIKAGVVLLRDSEVPGDMETMYAMNVTFTHSEII
jgi:hypothetical protein